jgi:hypothetical protein
LGGQNIGEVSGVLVTGTGISARIAENYRRLDFQEMQLLNEQLRVLREESLSASARAQMEPEPPMMMSEAEIKPLTSLHASADTNSATAALTQGEADSPGAKQTAARRLMARIEKRTMEFVPNPACASIASLMLVEITIAPDAEPGEREIRLVTPNGVSNPLVFYVGQLPEVSKKPMTTATQQVLGKESQALRKQLPGQNEQRITVPCTVNGQIASSEVNRYRFEARKGQRLIITTLGRQLVPFIADAVPGWFQPVLALYDANGKELAYDDDYRFKPDPTIFYEVPADGEYVFAIRDSLYRGREDFVYRITIGELPFITSIFPLGAPAAKNSHNGAVASAASGSDQVDTPQPSSIPSFQPEMKGWNLEGAELAPLPANAGTGIYSLAASKKGLISNRVPFALGTLPEVFEQEPNNTPAQAQKVTLPVIINGRIGKPDDWDVYQFDGKSNDMVVAEVIARRLDSPLDSVIKLTDAVGNLVAFNDDHEDLASGLNTHQADSYFMARLPADGVYYLHIGDTARQGGEEYGYRLRLSAPQPDFELRVEPSSLALRAKSSAPLTVYAQRKDGFTGPIKLALKDPPRGFSASPVTLASTQTVARLNIRTDLTDTKEPVMLSVVGTAKVDELDLARVAAPTEDRMQAFLWRQLVPAKDLRVLVFDPSYKPPPKRIAHARPVVVVTNAPVFTNALAGTNALALAKPVVGTNSLAGTNGVPGSTNAAAKKPKFTKQQVAGRLRQLKLLFEEGMLTDDFYNDKVAECEAAE